MANWLVELTRAFSQAFPDDETVKTRRELPDRFFQGLHESLGDVEVDFVHAVEHEDQTSFLVARGNGGWIARFTPPDTTNVLFVVDLRFGRYAERLVPDDKGGIEIEVWYEHRRLGRGRPLSARIAKPPRVPGTSTSTETGEALERW